MKLNWMSPYPISNAIIETNQGLQNAISAIETLDKINCPHYLIISEGVLSIEELTRFCNSIEVYSYKTVEFIITYNDNITEFCLERLLLSFPRVRSVVVSDAKFSYNNFENGRELGLIYFTMEKINHHSDDIKSIQEYFTINIDYFTESLHFNTFFNRKICISAEGDVSNFPGQSPLENIYNSSFNI